MNIPLPQGSPSPPEWDLILSAAQKNSPLDIRGYVTQKGVPASHANGVGQSALHIAALWGHVECVQVLCELGANPNATNHLTAATPLIMALQSRKMDDNNSTARQAVVDVLLQYGADPTIADNYNRLPVDYIPADAPNRKILMNKLQPKAPPLLEAIQAGDLATVKTLLVSSAETVKTMEYRKRTPVQFAVDRLVADDRAIAKDRPTTDLEILQVLLDAGAVTTAVTVSAVDTLSMDEDESTEPPLVRLLQKMHKELGSSGKTTSKMSDDCHVLIQACQALVNHNKDGVSLLTQEQVSQFWHNAARRGNVTVLQVLHEHLGSLFAVNTKNRQGMTALHFAARSGQYATTEYLLGLPDVDATLTDQRGNTALQAASINGHEAIVALLETKLSS